MHYVRRRRANVLETFKSKPLKKGTTAYHIVKFIEAFMDVLDKHHSAFVMDTIKASFYAPIFSLFNPIEECWDKIKSNIKQHEPNTRAKNC